MGSSRFGWGSMLLVFGLILVLMPGKAAAFGAGNIPSIAQVEGHNWRHGDIEDMLKTIAFLKGKKWTTMLVQRTYFGNWLRDYSQAVDVGSLKGVNSATIRILVWVLSFLSFGYATEEFEVTEERLGVYRPEEHIDNPLGYADNLDARKFDQRLRGPVQPAETEIDMRTGMKNYIANESGGWATSAGYLRFSFARSIHFGRVYTSSAHSGQEADLCEALRCLGQALHCMEDFSAHSNYCELALKELGYHEVFTHCGNQSEINIQGKRVFPLVTGTFGGVDFLHSVLGEATDHFTQSEVDEMNIALKNAEQISKSGSGGGFSTKAFGGGGGGDFISLISKVPSLGGGFASEARRLQEMSAEQERKNQSYSASRGDFSTSRGDTDRANANVVPGMSPDFDPVETARKIYPILEFRDKIVRSINGVIAKIPGLEKLLEHISETLTAYILSLLAPFVRPIINQVSKALKDGSSGVISASANSQLEPWKNPRCTDPTHSMLSKDHFTNVLNPCAGRIASTVLQYVVPRVLYAWENPGVPIDEVVNDVLRAFHHPALRNESIEIQRNMFNTVRQWANEHPRRHELNHVLGSESVKNGKNHILQNQSNKSHSHGSGIFDSMQPGHGRPAGSLWSQIATRDLGAMEGSNNRPLSSHNRLSPSPQPSPNPRPVSPQYGYQQAPQAGGYLAPQGGPGGYANYPPQPNYGGGGPPPPPQGGYGGPPGGYGGYPPPGPGYGGPPPPGGGYGGPPPPPGGGYGGHSGYPGQQYHRY